jgi:uncharacterized damage-inducible protein DinB
MTNPEITTILQQFNDTWNGDPWFGKPITEQLEGITETEAYMQPSGQHSIAELVWHMVTWRQFVLGRIHPQECQDLNYFEEYDWREVGPQTHSWHDGVAQLHQTTAALRQALKTLDDAVLEQQVTGRSFTFRKLFYGIVQHDIYHLGQIAYLHKLLAAQKNKV